MQGPRQSVLDNRVLDNRVLDNRSSVNRDFSVF